MVNLFKTRKFAIILTVAVAVIATLLGVRATANRYTREIEAMFFSGVYLNDDGYTQPSIDSHLGNCVNAALGLATIMENYPELKEESQALILAQRNLTSAKNVRDKSSANRVMRDSFLTLIDKAGSVDLTDRDINAAALHYTTFKGALNAILNSAYNDKVTDYYDGQSAIMRILVPFTFASQPASFITSPFPEKTFP